METEKFIESRKVEDYEIWTDEGWVDIQEVHKTIKFDVWTVETENFEIQCADEHIVIGENREEIYVKDLKIGDKIITENGAERVIRVEKLDVEPEHMYDLSIDSENHTFFSNGILSHNSTLATIFMLWVAIFNDDQRILLVANKENTAAEIFRRIRIAYEGLPNWLKAPVTYYGLESLELQNGSRISITTTTGTAGRGSSANLLFVDEMDFIECVEGSTTIKLKNVTTGKIEEMSIKDMHDNSKHLLNFDNFQILSDDGWKLFKGIVKNDNIKSVKLLFDDNTELICSEDHELLSDSGEFVLAKKSENTKLISDKGFKFVKTVSENGKIDAYDVTEVEGSRYYTNGVISHNCNMLSEFWSSVYPIISSSKKSKIIVASTPKDTSGLLYKLYDGSVKGTNNWAHMKVLWSDVPGRDEKWKNETISALGDVGTFRREFECVTGETLLTILNNNETSSITIEELYKLNKNGIKVLTPSGFKNFNGIQKLKKECLELVLKTTSLKCSTNHKILTKSGNFKFSNELTVGEFIKTSNGYDEIVKIQDSGFLDVYDLLNVETKQYYTNDIVSHNCTFDEVGESAIDEGLFDDMRKYTMEPMYIFENGCYLLWEKPNPERLYVAGVDIAEGVGKDATVIQVLDITEPTRIKQVAIYHNNKISPSEFTPKLREILQHWGDPLAMIERNGCGAQVVDNLKREFSYDNIVNWGINKVANKKSMQHGLVSHTNTKYTGVMNQRYWVNTMRCVQINDINTVLDMKDFIRNKSGHWSAKNGANDDRVMALVWALMILHEDIAPVYFDIIDKDEFGKPKVIKSVDYGIRYFSNPSSIYTNEKDGIGGDSMPMIFGGANSDNTDMDDLMNQGWKPLNY
jgi:hypothetical protein